MLDHISPMVIMLPGEHITSLKCPPVIIVIWDLVREINIGGYGDINLVSGQKVVNKNN